MTSPSTYPSGVFENEKPVPTGESKKITFETWKIKTKHLYWMKNIMKLILNKSENQITLVQEKGWYTSVGKLPLYFTLLNFRGPNHDHRVHQNRTLSFSCSFAKKNKEITNFEDEATESRATRATSEPKKKRVLNWISLGLYEVIKELHFIHTNIPTKCNHF